MIPQKYCLIFALVFLYQNLWAYSMPDPTYKEIKRGTNSKIVIEKIRLIINQNELKDFCKEVGIEEVDYQFTDKYQTLLFCFTGNSNEKEDLIKITGTRQHSLDLADMTVYLNRDKITEGNLFQPFIVYEIRALGNPDQDTSLFVLKHHDLSKEEIDKKKLDCAFARMIKYNTQIHDGKTFTHEELQNYESLNLEDLKNAFRPYFEIKSIENLEVSLDNKGKHDSVLFKNIKESIGSTWFYNFDLKYIKENQLTIKNKLTIKNNEKSIEFDVYQIETHWYSKKGLINIAFAKESKRGIVFVMYTNSIENK